MELVRFLLHCNHVMQAIWWLKFWKMAKSGGTIALASPIPNSGDSSPVIYAYGGRSSELNSSPTAKPFSKNYCRWTWPRSFASVVEHSGPVRHCWQQHSSWSHFSRFRHLQCCRPRLDPVSQAVLNHRLRSAVLTSKCHIACDTGHWTSVHCCLSNQSATSSQQAVRVIVNTKGVLTSQQSMVTIRSPCCTILCEVNW